jgi:hypothetical protein
MSLYGWIGVCFAALALGSVVVWWTLVLGWAALLHRVARSGIRTWDELEAETGELYPFAGRRSHLRPFRRHRRDDAPAPESPEPL